MIAAVYALLYYLLFDNDSKRTKWRFLSRAEGWGENVKGRGFKICQRFICLIVYYYLYFLERKRSIDLSTSVPGSRKTKLGYLWQFLSAVKKPLWWQVSTAEVFKRKKKINKKSDLDHGLQNKSKFRAISVSLPLPLYLRRSRIFTPIFLYIRCKFPL